MDAEWEIPYDELKISTLQLGAGSFACVYLAEWRGTPVVVKVFKEFCLENKRFLIEREIDIMTRLHHPNIVQVLGYVREPFLIVMEYVPRGDLLANMSLVDMPCKIHIMRDCLRSLAYLHNRKPNSLIHRDIKLTNILLTTSKVAKIADFGLSRLTDSIAHNASAKADGVDPACSELTRSVGTERYKAPEMKREPRCYTNKVDIYALGIAMYELFERTRYDAALKWQRTPLSIRRVIIECMLCDDPDARASAMDTLARLQAVTRAHPSIFQTSQPKRSPKLHARLRTEGLRPMLRRVLRWPSAMLGRLFARR